MIDYNDIKQTIAENLPDNNRREITAARLRDTLDGFVDKVQVTEAGLEGKVSANESNIGNLSGRVDSLSGEVSGLSGRVTTNETNVNDLTGRVTTNETNVNDLTGRVDSLSGEVSGLSGRVDDLSGSIGSVPRIVDNPIKGGANDVASMKWDTTIAAIAGLYTAESNVGGNALKINKVSVIDGGYVKSDGTIVQLGGYSYFEYTLLKKNGYIIIPAERYGAVVASDGGAIGFAFYDKDGGAISYNFDIIDWQFSGQLELKVPYGATMIRASLINGTFDPDNLYVIESTRPNNCNQTGGLWRMNKEYASGVDYIAKIGTDGKPVIDGANWLSVIKLLAGDELEMEISGGEGAQLAVSDSNNIEGTKVVIYQKKLYTSSGWLYYKADKDCYAFMSEPSSVRVIHNNRTDGNMQYEMMALMNKIRPTLGSIITDSEGKGIYQYDASYSTILFKVPIIPNTTLNYRLHGNDGTFSLSEVAYWYSGQPTPTSSVNTQISFDNDILSINNATSNAIGYALVTIYFDASIAEDNVKTVYLEKVTE